MKIELSEYGHSAPIRLSSAQLDALSRLGAETLAVQPTGSAGLYTLKATSYVGELSIPGLRVSIRPKVATANLLYIVSAIGLVPDLYPGSAPMPAGSSLVELLAGLFADRVERLVRHGLHRAYVTETDMLPYVRGRLLVQRQARVSPALRHRFVCEYAEHVVDVAENRALLFALRRLLVSAFLKPALRSRLRWLADAFAAVSFVSLSARDIVAIPLTRLTAHYRPALTVAALIVGALPPEQGEGAGSLMQSFLLDMNKVYEAYVTAVAQRELLPHNLHVHSQSSYYFDEDRQHVLRPDIVVTNASGEPLLVADVKYKVPKDGLPVSSDLYQVLAYANIVGVRRVALIYPEIDPRTYRVVEPVGGGGGVTVDVIRFSLDGSRDQLDRRAQALGTALRCCGS